MIENQTPLKSEKQNINEIASFERYVYSFEQIVYHWQIIIG